MVKSISQQINDPNTYLMEVARYLTELEMEEIHGYSRNFEYTKIYKERFAKHYNDLNESLK